MIGNWQQRGFDIDGEFLGDRAGKSISLSADGSVLAIGAPIHDGHDGETGDEIGQVRIFEYVSAETGWEQRGSDIDGEFAGDNAGWYNAGWSVSLSADGSVVAIGAYL